MQHSLIRVYGSLNSHDPRMKEQDVDLLKDGFVPKAKGLDYKSTHRPVIFAEFVVLVNTIVSSRNVPVIPKFD